jgi:hypothetical protein
MEIKKKLTAKGRKGTNDEFHGLVTTKQWLFQVGWMPYYFAPDATWGLLTGNRKQQRHPKKTQIYNNIFTVTVQAGSN